MNLIYLAWLVCAASTGPNKPTVSPDALTDYATKFQLTMPRCPAGVYNMLIFLKDARATLDYHMAPVLKEGWDVYIVKDLQDVEGSRSVVNTSVDVQTTKAVGIGYTRFIDEDEPLEFQFHVKNPYTVLGYRRNNMLNIRVYFDKLYPINQQELPTWTEYNIPSLVIPCNAFSPAYSLPVLSLSFVYLSYLL
ncbi:hypothetical protein DSO57_1022692 [Entomophthora muscae]|uniref:Uncharacterized protein n=1 Tax=Entomophthora muscae TaxID=34485 RepID=A0ACC2UC43_9FUNG|nr:hypothetical protein DSO57_1022692 [Entomophthora muscae]